MRISPALAAISCGASLLACLCFSRPAGAVASAEVYTTAAYRYGKFEQRMQVAAGDGIVSSVFLWKSGSEMAGTFWNELDFEKIDADCSLQLNAIYGNPSQNHQGKVALGMLGLDSLCTAYHTYAYTWTPTYIAWSIDGVEVRRDTDAATVQAYVDNAPDGMQIHFNVWAGTTAFGGNFQPSELPSNQYIRWVQYSTYTPGAGDGGSDFTLAWRETFDKGFPAGWAKGTWASPLQQSTHSPANVNVVDGVLVLSLTADDATGYSGTPPADPGDASSATGSGATSTGASGATSSSGTATGTGTGGAASSSGGSDAGCGCKIADADASPIGARLEAIGALALLIGARLRWRKARGRPLG